MAGKEDESGRSYKMAVLGGGGVGKSALTIRFVTNNFMAEYDPTLEAKYKKKCSIDDVDCTLDILDTAGQDEYLSMLDQWIRECTGFLLVYSIDDEASFVKIAKIKEKIARVKEGESPPLLLVGNKCDMESRRKVSKEQGATLAAKWGAGFLETSAATRVNSDECFYHLARRIRDYSRAPPAPVVSPGPSCGCVIM